MILTSCGDDEAVSGCTDSNAENFNPDAEESDNSCVYARDKFIGIYEGSITFQNLSALDQTDVEFSITPGIASANQLLVQLTIENAPLTLDGEASGNNIIIDYENTLPNGGVVSPILEGQAVDFTFDGTVSTMDGGDNIMGALDVSFTGEIGGMPTTIDDVGTLTGTKK